MKNRENDKPALVNSNNIAVQANRFIEARYKESLTFWESFLITKMCSMIEPSDVDFKPYKICMREVVNYMELTPSGQVYTYIMDAAKRLLDRRIIIGAVDEFGRQEIIETHIVTSVRRLREPKQGENMYVTLTFLPELKPFLLQLHRDFTKLDMEIFKQLKTASSIRLYQIFKSHLGKNQHKITFKLDDLKEILGVSEKYGQYAGFKMRVLDEAQQRLSSKTDISFTYEEIKEGKKVSALIFHILNNKLKSQEQPSNISLTKPIIVQQTEVEKEKLVLELTAIVVKTFGVSLKVFMDLVAIHTEGDIREAVKLTEKAQKTKKIDNIAGFFVKAVQEHYQENKVQEEHTEKQRIAKQRAEQEEQKEREKKQNINDTRKAAFLLEEERMAALIEQDANLATEAIEHIQRVSTIYDTNKSLSENLQNPSINAAFHLTIKKLRPEMF